MFVQKQEEHLEVDEMENKSNDEQKLDAKEEFLMSAIQIQNQNMTEICYVECLIVELIMYVVQEDN